TEHLTAITVMPKARSLQLSQTAPTGVTLENLISTAQNSWGETNLAGLQQNPPQIAYDQGTDIPGPLTVAASGEDSAGNGRLVTIGNSTFATDAFFDAYANGDFFVNSVDWAAGQGNIISITPHNATTRTFNPPPQLTFILIMLGTVIVIPGLVIAGGLSNWLSRRRRG
ncbi:MAG TPA: hypothetical protein VMJ64_01645, partial [Anaerolineales bacterium]|nr:hypothetical protein [Anaerolineales bacterium]